MGVGVTGGTTGGLFWSTGVAATGIEEEEEEGGGAERSMHFGEDRRLAEASEEFEAGEATRAATARAATARRWRA